MESNMEVPQETKLNYLAIQRHHSYPKECALGYNRVPCTPMFNAALFTLSKLWKQPRCPTTVEWIKKMWYLYTMEFYSAINIE
jgi:hypothetical protein